MIKTGQDPISVLVVDDQPLVRMGNALVLDSADGIGVVGEAADGAEAALRTHELHPDIVIMDVRMPVMDGIEATRRIVRCHHQSRVIVLTTFDLDEFAFGALRAGASAFLLKSITPEALIAAVRTVAAGESVVEPRITRQLIEQYSGGLRPSDHSSPVAGRAGGALTVLTPREYDIFVAIARGLSNSEICAEFYLSAATVKSHINRIFFKLDLRDRVQAVILAYEIGIARVAGFSSDGS